MLDAADTGPWRKRVQQALQTGDWKALEQVVEEALAARQPPSVLLRLADMIRWDSPTRLEVLRRICQAHPGDFWANHNLALHLHIARHRYEEAIRYYKAALALRPHNPADCVNLGAALRGIGELDDAEAAYREALNEHPDYSNARHSLGLLLEAKGDVDGAIAELREGVRLGNRATDYLLLGNALFRGGNRDEAIASYKKVIALDPNSDSAYYNLGTALLEKKECLQEAIDSFQNAVACRRRLIALNPAYAGSQNDLAWLLVTCPYVPLRDLGEGLKLARKAVELSPLAGEHWNTLGVAHYRAGNWKDAVAALERSMELRAGGDSYDWFFLAMAYCELGDKAQARQWFDRAVQWMDKNMPAGKELGRFRAEAADLLKLEMKKDGTLTRPPRPGCQ